MATGSALNLSLLSRGVGEVTRNGSEKVDVIFEPQDYFNFVEESHDRPFFLPPLQPRYGFTQEPSQISSRYSHSKDAVHLPKTFTTRKGALLLFSEDMAHKTKASEAKKHKHHHGHHSDRDMTISELEESSTDRDLKTVDDLAKSILAYGSIDESGNMNLKVMAQRTKRRRYDYERQIRPGFSAKRYLSTWTKTWDDTTLEKVISKGYLTEKSLFYYNPLLPHLSRRLNDDLSHYPTPYKLMRSMLMSPGSLSGYTFYRVRPESQETDYIDISEDEEMRSLVKSRQAGSVKVASVTADGQLKEAIYGQLDRQAQAEVLTDLLVKGAVHYAMKTQQEYVERIVEEPEELSDRKVVPKFDMRDAVESMLQANDQKGVPQQTLDADLPERDDRSQHSGSFKGSKLGSHRLHPRDRGQGEGQWRDDASSGSSTGAPGPLPTTHAPLPPIGQTYTQLTPIGEASREHTQAFSLPVNGKDDDDGEDWAGRRMVEKHIDQKAPSLDTSDDKRRTEMLEKRKARVSAQSLDLEGAPAGAGFSSSDSVGPGSTHSSGWLPPVHKQQWKGSQQSLRSHGSRRASGSQVDADVGSTKGSIIYGPDGSVIKVGESVKLSARASQQSYHDPHEHLQPGLIDASDDSDAEAPDAWKLQGRRTEMKKPSKRESPRSKVTEQEIIDKLTSHATHIAESVLSHSESGQLLEEDIRRAAALWMDTHPPRDISRSQSVQDLQDATVIQEVMKVQKRNSAGPTVAEYRDQIRGNLMTALAKATGLKQSDIPQDAEIDPELLEQLANNTLAPDDIEIVRDDETGRSFIRSRNRVISEAMGGVEKGHIYQPGGKNGDAGKRVSIPSERKPAEIGELDIINYQGQDSEKDSSKGSKAGSEVGSKKLSSGKPKSVSQDEDGKSSKAGKDSHDQDELQKALADLEQGGSSAAVSLKSGKSGKTQKSEDKKSKVSEKKAVSPEKKEEFVVGKVQNKKELEELYSQPVHAPEPKESIPASGVDHTKENSKIYGMPPNVPVSPRKPKEKKATKAPVAKKKPEKGAKKGKGKAKKKEEPAPEPETAVEAESPIKEKTPEPVKEKTPKSQTPVSERTESAKQESDDDEEYIIVRDETMSPEVEQPDVHLNMTTSAEEEEPDEEQITAEDLEDMSEADKLRMISNREARAAKRAAAAEKRRQEVERKRREREEQIKREKEEHERQEVLRQEQEELRKRKEEERRLERLKKQKEEEENEEQMKEELEKQRREKAEAEKERRRKEDYAKKLEMMKAKQAEEEKRRQEEAERKRLEEEERRKEEEEMMAKMAEEERLEYERKKKLEEEERIRKEEEEKKRREEEAQRALEEARRLAEEMARKQAELEARLRFNRSLQMEANGLEHTQDITKAFVFSYFELLQWLGLDIPEFELLKLNQY